MAKRPEVKKTETKKETKSPAKGGKPAASKPAASKPDAKGQSPIKITGQSEVQTEEKALATAKPPATTPTELATSAGSAANELNQGLDVPSYLKGTAGDTLDLVKTYQTLSRLLIVQGTSGQERKVHGVGSMILAPENLLVSPVDSAFIVIPLFAWTTFEKRKDFNDQDDRPMILESTRDPNSELAHKAKALAEQEYKAADGKTRVCKYVQAINFAFLIDTPGEGADPTITPRKVVCVHTFAISSFKVGRTLCQILAKRNVAMYASRILLSTTEKEHGNGNTSFQFELNNPSAEDGGAWVAETDLAAIKAIAETVRDHVEANTLNIVGADEPTSGEGGGEGGTDDLPPI